MNLEELYTEVNGNYSEVVSRFGNNEAMVNKFVHRFLDDHSIEDCIFRCKRNNMSHL